MNTPLKFIKPAATVTAFWLVVPALCWSQQETDITNAVLTSRAVDCASYAGAYHSQVRDIVSNRTIDGQLSITADDGVCTFSVNQIPNHDFGENAHWPHSAEKNADTLRIPANAAMADTPTPIGLGPAAIMLNGVKWEPNPAACFGEGKDAPGQERIGCGPRHQDHPWRYNIGSALNKFGFDNYHAHVQRGGMYHYHATPRVLYTQNARLFDDSDCATSGPSPVIGFALDGFPIYGPCLIDNEGITRTARSSYVVKTGVRQAIENYETPYVAGVVTSAEYNGQFVGDFEYAPGSGDLDACNGTTVDGQYGYYATASFPYAIRCLSGTPLMAIK